MLRRTFILLQQLTSDCDQKVFVQIYKDQERIRKQLYMSCKGFSSAHRRAWTNSWMKFTCKLWTKARPSANKKGEGVEGVLEWGDRQNQWQVNGKRKSISKQEYCQSAYQQYVVSSRAGRMHALPPVSLSSTKISNFSSLQGISGSSPMTVKVASNSPSTRNFTRPLATHRRKRRTQNFLSAKTAEHKRPKKL